MSATTRWLPLTLAPGNDTVAKTAMQVTTTSYTIAEYCTQMADNTIVANADYQRSNKVWPHEARSYLIDTILAGYPIPKLILAQKTDLKTRKTVKDIVDGQQRSRAVLDFFNDKLRLSKRSAFPGLLFSQLDEAKQQEFISYQLGTDVLVGAVPGEIREVFRRMNSYTVPLNPQERRHAIYQGAFKWFIHRAATKYTDLLKTMGVLTERKISRMDDTELLAEITLAHANGIDWGSPHKIDAFYKAHEDSFEEDFYGNLIDRAFDRLIGLEVADKPLLKEYNFYSIMVAIMAIDSPTERLEKVFSAAGRSFASRDVITGNLNDLAAALDSPESFTDLRSFVEACASTTTKKTQREVRHQWFCRALTEESIRRVAT
jgi:hypothetical protein